MLVVTKTVPSTPASTRKPPTAASTFTIASPDSEKPRILAAGRAGIAGCTGPPGAPGSAAWMLAATGISGASGVVIERVACADTGAGVFGASGAVIERVASAGTTDGAASVSCEVPVICSTGE